MQTLTFPEVERVRDDISMLMPGYYRPELDPFAALENQQGNCFTSSVVAAVAISLAYDVDSTLVWSEKLHGRELDAKGFFMKGAEKGVVRDIQHVNLVVPRGVDEYDILGLNFGQSVVEGGTETGMPFEKNDTGARIINFNFEDIDPSDEDVAGKYLTLPEGMPPELCITDDYEIKTTEYGEELGLVAYDWQLGANEYLAALDIEPIDYEWLVAAFMPKYAALRDWKKSQEVVNS